MKPTRVALQLDSKNIYQDITHWPMPRIQAFQFLLASLSITWEYKYYRDFKFPDLDRKEEDFHTKVLRDEAEFGI